MSASFSVQSGTGSYEVVVAQGSFAETLARIAGAHVLADAFFRSSFRDLPASPILLDATERAKSLERMAGVIEAMRAAGVGRSHHLVAIGGGVIQDIAAFVASIYMRGLAWDYLPTTVLAMVDSCIGGKSSINVGPYKNLAGTFHPPRRIAIDPELAETLPREQFASGLIEAAKICFCRGPESFARHLACEPSLTMSTAALEAAIVNSLRAKKHFIEIDEFDKKERLLLNFGHTFGHAIEGASHYGIPHGIAVGIGILCSLAFQRGRGIEPAGAGPLEAHLLQMIRALPTLRHQLQSLDLADVLDRFASDKKHTRTHYTLILVAVGGEVALEQIPRSGELEARLRRAISDTIEGLSL